MITITVQTDQGELTRWYADDYINNDDSHIAGEIAEMVAITKDERNPFGMTEEELDLQTANNFFR